MGLTIETELEEDGRWLAEVPQLSGVLAYGTTCAEAIDHAKALRRASSLIAWNMVSQCPNWKVSLRWWHESLAGNESPQSARRTPENRLECQCQTGGSHRALERPNRRTMCSPFMTRLRLALACWRELPVPPVCGPRTYNHPETSYVTPASALAIAINMTSGSFATPQCRSMLMT